MSDPILTKRLKLIPLRVDQLELVSRDSDAFETSVNIRIMRSWMTERVHRAITIKIDKMHKADSVQQDWLTYWLIVIRDDNTGAGMLGFKGFPDENGSTEIGYGIDPVYQGKGYMSEAVQALIDWAFMHPFCSVVTATDVENPASSRLLEKIGAELVSTSERSTSWKIQKSHIKPV